MAIQSTNPPELFTLEKWQGANQQNRRSAIGDNELFWCENLMPIGDGNLRSMWGASAPIYTSPGPTIRRIFFGYYGNTTPLFGQPPPGRMGWMFLDDGNVDEVDLDTGTVTRIGKIWEPISPQYWADVKVWRPRYVGHAGGEVGGIVIGSPLGLYAWDGVNLYSPGDTAPNWLSNDDVTNPATPTTMPIGLTSIYAMEVYQERLWIAGKTVIQFSAPTNGADFAATDGGGSFGYFGDKLVHDFVDVATSSGYLFVFGDSSTDVIANVQLAGQGTPTNPFITNFNYSNVDPQVGQRFPRPVGHWGRYFVLFNGAGIFEMQGGDAQTRGNKMLTVLDSVDSSSFYPTMTPVTMFGKRLMLINGMFTDPWNIKRSMMLVWDGEKWWTASQWKAGAALNLTNIGSYADNSTITAYGTDGQYLYQLFAKPDSELPKRLSTKSMRGTGNALLTIKNFRRLFLELYDVDGGGVSLTGTFSTEGGGIPNGVQDIGFEVAGGTEAEIPGTLLPTPRYAIVPYALSCAGVGGAIDLTSSSPDFVIERLHVMGEQRTLLGA